MNHAGQDEKTQRIRIGLTGLAFVFLLVLLGTAISRSGDDPAGRPLDNAMIVNAEPNEPLAEIGAAPGSAPTANGDDTAEQEAGENAR